MRMLQLDKLNAKLGLHDELIINYEVDQYSAMLAHENGIVFAEGNGKTIEEALQDLENNLS